MRYALFVMLLLATTARGLADGPTVSFVSPPEAIPGWSAKGAMREYDAKTLYEYIDGAADLFNSYGFVRLATADYVSGAGEHAVTVEVYDMGEPLQAFGLFASERPPDVKTLGLGNQGYAGDGVVAFWQGRQYVKVSQLSGEGLDDALAFARASSPVPVLPGLPSEFARLPAADRVRDSERYARQSALGHKFLDTVISAEYKLGKGTAELHLAELASPESAKTAWTKLREFEAKTGKHLAPLAGLGEEAWVVRDPSLGLMIAARTRSRLLIAISQTASQAAVTGLAKAGMALICAPKQ